MVLTKEEQLRLVFKHLAKALLTEFPLTLDLDKLIEKYTNIFLYETKIRVKL